VFQFVDILSDLLGYGVKGNWLRRQSQATEGRLHEKFRNIDFTVHPGDIPNEAAGKSSNISWAARQASRQYTAKIRPEVTMTVIDGAFRIPVL